MESTSPASFSWGITMSASIWSTDHRLNEVGPSRRVSFNSVTWKRPTWPTDPGPFFWASTGYVVCQLPIFLEWCFPSVSFCAWSPQPLRRRRGWGRVKCPLDVVDAFHAACWEIKRRGRDLFFSYSDSPHMTLELNDSPAYFLLLPCFTCHMHQTLIFVACLRWWSPKALVIP